MRSLGRSLNYFFFTALSSSAFAEPPDNTPKFADHCKAPEEMKRDCSTIKAEKLKELCETLKKKVAERREKMKSSCDTEKAAADSVSACSAADTQVTEQECTANAKKSLQEMTDGYGKEREESAAEVEKARTDFETEAKSPEGKDGYTPEDKASDQAIAKDTAEEAKKSEDAFRESAKGERQLSENYGREAASGDVRAADLGPTTPDAKPVSVAAAEPPRPVDTTGGPAPIAEAQAPAPVAAAQGGADPKSTIQRGGSGIQLANNDAYPTAGTAAIPASGNAIPSYYTGPLTIAAAGTTAYGNGSARDANLATSTSGGNQASIAPVSGGGVGDRHAAIGDRGVSSSPAASSALADTLRQRLAAAPLVAPAKNERSSSGSSSGSSGVANGVSNAELSTRAPASEASTSPSASGEASAYNGGGGMRTGAGTHEEELSPFAKSLGNPKISLMGSETEASVSRMLGVFRNETAEAVDIQFDNEEGGVGAKNGPSLFERAHAMHEVSLRMGRVRGVAIR